MDWIQTTKELPQKNRLVEVRMSGGGVLSPVYLSETKDDCIYNGKRLDWVYKSGLHASGVETEHVWRYLI